MLVRIFVTLISDILNREKQLTNKKGLFLVHVALGLRGGSAGSRGLVLLSLWPPGSRVGERGMCQGQNYSLQWCGSSTPLLKMRPYLPQIPSPKSLLKLESPKG